MLSRFLSGLGHNRCWFGFALVLCRHLPTSQSLRLAQPAWLALPPREESSPGTAGVAGALARGGEPVQALPTQSLATLSSTVSSLKYLGLVGLSLQLKLKHESSPGCFSLCAECVCAVPEACHGNCWGGAFQGTVLIQGSISSGLASCWSLLLSAPERQGSVCQQKVTFGTVLKVILHMFTDMAVLPSLTL